MKNRCGRIYVGLATLSALVFVRVIRAEDWPRFRGRNRDSVWRETGILASFPAQGLNMRWRAAVGLGWSSPVIAKGRVYLTDAALQKSKAQERVLCFEEATGKPLWTFCYDVAYPDWAFTPGQEGRPTATPLVHGGKLYTLGKKGDLYCFEAAKGERLWKRNLERDYRVQEFAFNASPLIESNFLILCIGSYVGTNPSFVLALDKNSGKEIWKAPNEGLTNSSPLVITSGGKRQLIVWTQRSVISLDPATGKTHWQERMRTSADSAVATPVFHKNLLLVSGLMLKLDSEKPAATVVWPDTKAAARRILSNTSTPLIQGDHLFSAKSSGHLVCLSASTGKEIWETDKVTDLKQGASIHLTPNGDSVFLYTDKGELIRAHLSSAGYQEISRTRLLEPTYPFAGRKVVWPPPAFANRHVFARNDQELICVSLEAKK